MQDFRKYLQYIKNTGGVSPDEFDVDWEPIGPKLRRDMIADGLIEVVDNQIKIKSKKAS